MKLELPDLEFEVRLYELRLVLDGVERRLTRREARQLPLLDPNERWEKMRRGEPVPPAICKVSGEALGVNWRWLYLVPDYEAGLGWVPAMPFDVESARAIIEAGGYVENPAQIPTVLL